MRKVWVTALLLGGLMLPSGCQSGDAVKTPEPTAAPTPGTGQLVSIAGDGTGWGWDGRSPAAGHATGEPGVVLALPGNKVLLTSETPPQALQLDAAGNLTDLKAQEFLERIVAAAAADGKTIGLLSGGDSTLQTLRLTDGAIKLLARLPRIVRVGDPYSTSLVRRPGGWWVQRGAQILQVSDAGKISPVTLPVKGPTVLATDGTDILAATKDEVLRIVNGKITQRMSLRGLNLGSPAAPVSIVADGKGGAYVAIGTYPAVVHATPGAAPKLLLQGKSVMARCADVPTGNPLDAPLKEIEALTLRNGDLVIADRGCSKIYQYGLPK